VSESRPLEPGIERACALAASHFPSRLGSGKAGALAAIRGLGFLQIDSISVVERAHHHVLWTRVGGYKNEQLSALEADRSIIEYWAHAASYLPIKDYRYCLPRMLRVRECGHDWYGVDRKEAARVLDRIRAEGALKAKDFQDVEGRPRSWWDRKPAKRALEYLFHSGLVLCASREGIQKSYDLAERVLPPGLDTRLPSPKEMARHYIDSAARAYGCFCADDIAYQRVEHLEGIEPCLRAMIRSGELIALDSSDGKPRYARPEALKAAATYAAPRGLGILSPFDPLIIQRKRTARVFGVDIALECYLPAAKRRFGYFALPLLWGSRIVGLLDAKADRDSRLLVLKNLSLSLRPSELPRFLGAFAKELDRFASFNAVEPPQAKAVEALAHKALSVV
jgi:uncharacterized protein